jgi:membrane protein implicated in regulation of membrane protease activity
MASLGVWAGIIYEIFIVALMIGAGAFMLTLGGPWLWMGAGILVLGIIVGYFTYRSYHKAFAQGREVKAKLGNIKKPWEQ